MLRYVTAWAVLSTLMLCAVVYVYVVHLRPYLKTLPGFADAYRRQDSLYAAIRVWLVGRREVLLGVWGNVLALGPDAIQLLMGLDLKALLGLPDLWAAWVLAMLPILMLLMRAKREESQ